MKLHPQFILHSLQEGVSVLVPVGQAAQRCEGLYRLNETAAFIVSQLKNECTQEQLLSAIRREYQVNEEELGPSVNEVLRQLRDMGALVEQEEQEGQV